MVNKTFNQLSFYLQRGAGKDFLLAFVGVRTSEKASCIKGWKLKRCGNRFYGVTSKGKQFHVKTSEILREIYNYWEYEPETVRQSHKEGKFQPEALAEAMSLNLEGLRQIYLNTYWEQKMGRKAAA